MWYFEVGKLVEKVELVKIPSLLGNPPREKVRVRGRSDADEVNRPEAAFSFRGSGRRARVRMCACLSHKTRSAFTSDSVNGHEQCVCRAGMCFATCVPRTNRMHRARYLQSHRFACATLNVPPDCCFSSSRQPIRLVSSLDRGARAVHAEEALLLTAGGAW